MQGKSILRLVLILLPTLARAKVGVSLQYLAMQSDFRGVQANYEQPFAATQNRLALMASLAGYWRIPEADSGSGGWSARLLPKWYFTDRWHLGLPVAYTRVGRSHYLSTGLSAGRKVQIRRFYFEFILGFLRSTDNPRERWDTDPPGSGENRGHAFGLDIFGDALPNNILAWIYPNLGADFDLAIGYHF